MTTRLALFFGSCLTLGCGDAGATSATEVASTSGSLDCEEPDYYAPTEDPDVSCGCYKQDYSVDPWYISCVGEACANGNCGGLAEQTACLWDGVALVSGGSFCATPCSPVVDCPVIDGIQTVCHGLYCIIPCEVSCPDRACTFSCPEGMFCVEEPAGGIGELYCVYDYRP